MAKFLLTAWPFTGHLYHQISIARALGDRGHECVFYTGKRAVPLLEEQAFRYFLFRHVDEELVWNSMFSLQDGARHWTGFRRFTSVLRKWLLDPVAGQVQDLEELLGQWRPDVIACDPTLWGPILVSGEKHHIPVAVSSSVAVCMIPGPGVPPFGLGLPRAKDIPSRLRVAAAAAGSAFMTAGFRRAASTLRESHGLAPLDVPIMQFMRGLPLYIVPTARELDYDRTDLPPAVQYVGPCVWNRSTNAARPQWLDELPRDRPWVHVTEGTLHVDDPFVLRAAVQGLADLPMQLILTTGNDRNPADMKLGRIAANMHLVRWVAHTDLLPHTGLVVTTGGAGTVLASLSFGVPLIVVPTEWEKPEMAQRVVDAGAGLRLSPRHCTPHKMRTAVERILGDPAFTENARRLSRILAGYGGPPRAAELLEQLAARVL